MASVLINFFTFVSEVGFFLIRLLPIYILFFLL